MILTVKEIMLLFDCSETTAMNHMKAMRKLCKTKFITKYSVADYLGLDFLALEASYQIRVKGDFVSAAILLNMRDRLKMRSVAISDANKIIIELYEELRQAKAEAGLKPINITKKP